MGFFLAYLRKHFHAKSGDDYNVIPAFKASQFIDQTTAEKEFKQDVNKIALWSPSNLQRWAAEQSKTFTCLQKADYQTFWTSRVVERTLDSETRSYYEHRYQQASSSSQGQVEKEYDELNEEVLNEKVSNEKVSNERHHNEKQYDKEDEPYDEATGTTLEDTAHIQDEFNTDKNDDEASIDIEFPSDLSNDYHPRIEDEYYFQHENQVDGVKNATIWRYSVNEELETSEIDIIDELRVFRSVSQKLEPKGLSDLRLLALNHTYLFTNDYKRSITAYLPECIHRSIMTDLVFNNPAPEISDQSVLWCTKLSKIQLPNWFEVQKITIPFLHQAMENMNEAPLDLMIANILHRAALSFSNNTPNSDLEDSFVHFFIANLFDNVFQTESILEANWANGQLGGKRKHDDEYSQFKPDYVIFVTQRQNRLDVSCAEAKSPVNRYTFPKSDLVKIGQEMRWMLNKLIRAGVKQPVTGGVLISGFVMHTYKMELIDVGIYRMTELSQTSIFRNMQELTLVPTIVANLLQLKDVTLTTANKSKTRLREMSKGVPASPDPPETWIRDSMIELVKR